MGLIVALDPPEGVDGVEWCLKLVRELGDVPSGYKLGLPLALDAGVEGLRRVSEAVPPGKLLIADLKLADIGYVMSLTAKKLARAGVNALIAHAFVGVKGALDELVSTCSNLGIKLVLVALMSHPGATRFMASAYGEALRVVKEVGAWGAVLPATKPEAVREGRKLLGESVKILSPGIGAQGAEPGTALRAGADYEIVGRLVTRASNPRAVAEGLVRVYERVLGRR